MGLTCVALFGDLRLRHTGVYQVLDYVCPVHAPYYHIRDCALQTPS